MSLYDLAFSAINAPLSILLIGLAVYRFTTMIVGLDLDFDFDFDADFDIDADIDMEADFDTETCIDDLSNIEIQSEALLQKKQQQLKWWQILLVYFNFTELPFMFTFTSWVFFWWAITLFATYYTNSYDSNFGVLVFLAAVIPALFLNKLFTIPFKAFFKKLQRKGVAALNLLGKSGTLLSNISGDKLGSAKLIIESDPIQIYVKSLDGETITRGQEILIIKNSKDKKFYYIKSYNPS